MSTPSIISMKHTTRFHQIENDTSVSGIAPVLSDKTLNTFSAPTGALYDTLGQWQFFAFLFIPLTECQCHNSQS